MESSSLFVTPKRKFSRNTSSSSSQDTSPVDKRMKESISPDEKTTEEDEVMAAQLTLSESVTNKLDLILARLNSLDSRMEELNSTVKSLQSKTSAIEIEIGLMQDKQTSLDDKFAVHYQRRTPRIQRLSRNDVRNYEIRQVFKGTRKLLLNSGTRGSLTSLLQ